ncbi:MAG TPA: NAD(P)/FAD-dependent oxidoreductase [Tepidisphaeraceae bacterium]|jgi:NADH dehydrogenase|nr:NAD(P)/FAD-dependent oxidoreductase [Tepidisphaeraceae bacterium]
MDTNAKTRILILGGGFAGVYTALGLQDAWDDDPAVEVTLVSRNNYFLMTPLLFEAGSGVLEPRHVVNPIRPLFDSVRFIEGEVDAIDVDKRIVNVTQPGGEKLALTYDQAVLAMGGITNTRLVAGSKYALTFKTLADAIFLRNHIIQLFERADVEMEAKKKAALLTFILVGGGLVNTELCGELTAFLQTLQKRYPRVNPGDWHVEIIEGEDAIAREFDEDLREYITDVLEHRGVKIRLNTRVKSIEPGCIHLPDGTDIPSETIVLGTGVVPSPVVAALPIEKDKHGRAITDATMQCKGRKDLWALGDCAQIPDPSGKPYPPLAQHALREARVLARNISAGIRGDALEPFVYKSKGTLAALGDFAGAGKLMKLEIRGFLAWWVWRTYYVMQMRSWSRRIRIILDWTVALFVKNDIVQLDYLFRAPKGDSAAARESE